MALAMIRWNPVPDALPVEIERKFLISGDDWRRNAVGDRIRQGYLARGKRGVVRVRIRGEEAFLTVKGGRRGIRTLEFEYSVPLEHAEAMLGLCEGLLIEKTRYRVEHAGHTWEIDVFHAENAGLVIAEIELASEDESFEHPSWLGAEVSADARYKNSKLSKNPYSSWSPDERRRA